MGKMLYNLQQINTPIVIIMKVSKIWKMLTWKVMSKYKTAFPLVMLNQLFPNGVILEHLFIS